MDLKRNEIKLIKMMLDEIFRQNNTYTYGAMCCHGNWYIQFLNFLQSSMFVLIYLCMTYGFLCPPSMTNGTHAETQMTHIVLFLY
jgi:hypothetical protein